MKHNLSIPLLCLVPVEHGAERMPRVDAHIHYSHDAWAVLSPQKATCFMLGTDTYTPERWFYLGEYHDWARGWLAGLPRELAANLAYRNAESLLQRD